MAFFDVRIVGLGFNIGFNDLSNSLERHETTSQNRKIKALVYMPRVEIANKQEKEKRAAE